MELFSLPCTTCNARLKVRDPSIVGKILACPKCGAMVLIKAPPDWSEEKPATSITQPTQATPASGSSSQILSKPAVPTGNFDDVDLLLEGKTPPPGSPSPPAKAKLPPASPPRKAAAPLPTAKQTASQPSVQKNPQQPPQPSAASERGDAAAAIVPHTPTPAVAAPPIENANPNPQSVHPSNVTAALLPATNVSPGTRSSPPQAPLPSAGSENSSVPHEPSPVASAAASLPVAADWNSRRPWMLVAASAVTGILLALAVAVVAMRLFGPGQSTDQTTAVNTPPPTETQTPTETNPVQEEPATPVDSVPAEPGQPEPQPEPVAGPSPPESNLPPLPQPISPQTVEPTTEADPLGIATSKPPATSPDNSTSSSPKVFGSLEKFADLLDGNQNRPKDPTLDDAPPPELPVDPTTSEQANNAPQRPAARRIEMTARLADPLLAIEADGVALYDFLQQMTELSTIPITLRPEGMQMLKRSPHTAVALRQQETTVGQAIQDAIRPMYLQMQPLDQQVVIQLAGDPREIAVPLDDLAAGEPDGAQTLIDHITDLFEPDSWNVEGSNATIRYETPSARVKHRPLVLWNIIDLTERLRVARSLPIRSKQDESLFSSPPRWQRAQVARDTKVGLNFSIPTSFPTIIDRLARSAKVRILIDWQALLAEGWTPDTEATLQAEKLSLEQALDELLVPMELTWRVYDAQTLEVTTQSALQLRPELELYPLPQTLDAAAADQVISNLRDNLGNTWFRDSGGSGVIRFDPAAHCLLVWLPQPQQRTLEKGLPAALPQP